MEDTQYDVAILGTGIAGSIIGTIMARHGHDVVMVDASVHPRFAIGESTVGHTSEVMQLISDRYDVPEIGNLASFGGIQDNVTSSCGVKRGFGFLFHRPDGTQRADEANQFVIPPLLHGPENHLFRQDVDAYMMHVAVKYGADVRQGTRITDATCNDDGVVLDTEDDGPIHARYLIDASGHGSPIARSFGLRENPTRLNHQSRALFTHMVDVKPYDECVEPKGAHDMPLKWFETTLHHLFEGGWMWVIPFNNHSRATNPLCSVGLMLDPRVHPPTDLPPEEEFYAFIEDFPRLREQFADAKAVRPWVSAPRIQYSSSQTVGDRFCLMSHAGGFVDPLFSRGLANTADIINALAWRLLDALEEDDFSAERFEYIESLQQGLVDFNDELVETAFASFTDYRLWNAWVRVWAIGEAGLDQLRLLRAHIKFKQTNDDAYLQALDDVDYPGLVCPDYEGFKELWDTSRDLVMRSANGELDPGDASQRIFELIEDAELIAPSMKLHDPSHRVAAGDLMTSLRVMTWGKFSAPREIQERYYDIPMSSLVSLAFSNARDIALAN